MSALLVALGVTAGVLTTISGLGGGLLLVLSLSLLLGPKEALAATAPALLLGNLHRVLLYRREVDRRVALSFVAGALPGSLLGGLLLPAIPSLVLTLVMASVTGLAVGKSLGLIKLTPPRAAVPVLAATVGALSATSGGAGLLAAPLLLSTGLTGRAYVATGAIGAVAMHTGRLLAYGHVGLLTERALTTAALLAASIFAGNLLGDRVRTLLGERVTARLEVGSLVLCAGLAVAGLR